MSGKHEVLYVPDRVTLVAAGVKQARHPGFTEKEYEERETFKLKVWHVALLGIGVLSCVAAAIGAWCC